MNWDAIGAIGELAGAAAAVTQPNSVCLTHMNR